LGISSGGGERAGEHSPGDEASEGAGYVFACLVAVDLGLLALGLAAGEPDAVVGGHRVVNSFGLLSAAMARADKAYGFPISELQAAGQGDDPDKCFFLCSPTGSSLIT
jgi:hypothetical protein